MNKFISSLFLSVLISCGTINSIYESDIVLSNRSAYSQTTNLQVLIPNGWRQVDVNTDNFVDLLLVSNVENAVIYFEPIYINSKNMTEISKIWNSYIATYRIRHNINSESFKHESPAIISTSDRVVEFNSDEFRSRIYLFPFENFYFACVARINPDSSGKDSAENIFSLQNSVLKSVAYKSK
ncbi:MAG: hypothetical protein JW995_05410 [Melioribacteraceae bacterium]|nr:hypothetical protein [Melioribacteraceae bacterium]